LINKGSATFEGLAVGLEIRVNVQRYLTSRHTLRALREEAFHMWRAAAAA
jgi:hypothetical protein